MKLAGLLAWGFDRSRHIPFTSRFVVKCSQCEALCINGIPCHEHGCPRERHECAGCSEPIPRNQKWCEQCS